MENRNGLILDADVLLVEGNHETKAALALLADHVAHGSTVGADKLYDNTDFVNCRRRLNSAPFWKGWRLKSAPRERGVWECSNVATRCMHWILMS
jgi:hypothetical protein